MAQDMVSDEAATLELGDWVFNTDVTIYCYMFTAPDVKLRDHYSIVYLDESGPDGVRTVTLPDDFRMACGDLMTIVPEVFPADGAKIKWSSSNPEIVSVSNGVLTALAPGTAKIKAKAGSATGSTTVEVYTPATGIELSSSELWMTAQESTQLSVTGVKPKGASYATLQWEVSDTELASVDHNGLVKAKKPGDVTVVCTTDKGIKRECLIHLTYPVMAVALSAESKSTGINGELQLTSTATTKKGKFVNKLVTFTSSDETIATVDSTGLVRGIKAGKVTVTATAFSGKSVAISLTVKDYELPILKSVAFSKTKALVKEEITIKAVTGTTATKLIMSTGGKQVKAWTKGYTDKDGKRTWKVTYAFGGAGERTLDFKAADQNGKFSAVKIAKITVTKPVTLTLNSVKFAKTGAVVKQDVTISAVTSTAATKLIMYADGKKVKAWSSGYTDSGDKRTWKVTYAFGGTGARTMGFKAADKNGKLTEEKTAKITVTKALVLSSVKFSAKQAKVKEEITITAVTSVDVTKLTMSTGGKQVKAWTKGYTDKDGKRTWKLTYKFSGAGKRTMEFKGFNAAGKETAAKTAAITITK